MKNILILNPGLGQRFLWTLQSLRLGTWSGEAAQLEPRALVNSDALLTLLAYQRGYLSSRDLTAVLEAFCAEPETSLRDYLVGQGLTVDQVLELESETRRFRPVNTPDQPSSFHHNNVDAAEKSMQRDLYSYFYDLDDLARKITFGVAGLGPLLVVITTVGVLTACLIVSFFNGREPTNTASTPRPEAVVQPMLGSLAAAKTDVDKTVDVATSMVAAADEESASDDQTPPNVVEPSVNDEAAEVPTLPAAAEEETPSFERRLARIKKLLESDDPSATLELTQLKADPFLPIPQRRRVYYLEIERLLRTEAPASEVWSLLQSRRLDAKSNDFIWDIQFARCLMGRDLDRERLRQEVSTWPEPDQSRYLGWIDSRYPKKDVTVRSLSLRFTTSNELLDGFFLGVAQYQAGDRERARSVFRFLTSELLEESFYLQPNPIDNWLVGQSLRDLRARCTAVAGTE